MIYGIGIDMVEISRIEKSLQNPHFMKRIFSDAEQQELAKSKTENIAAAFAAKEAFSKALGTGLPGIHMQEVSLLHEKSGKPYILLSGETEKKLRKLNLAIHVSVTHEAGLAQCIVVLEAGRPKNNIKLL